MTFRDIPRDIKDEKDMESFLRALREKAVSITSHSELKDIKEVDKSSTDTTRNKHVSDYDMKKVEDHMDDVSKHLAQELTGGSNYLSSVTGTSPINVTGTGTSRNVALIPFSHTNTAVITDVGSKTHDQIDTHIASTANPHSTSDANLVTTDVTTNNVSTSKHGFAPKAPSDATKYLDGTGAYSVPAGASYTGGNNIGIIGTAIHQVLEFGASAYRAGFQTIATSAWTKIQFDSLTGSYLDNDFDPLTNHDYLVPIAGYYHVDLLGGIIGLADGKEVRVAIYVNGTIVSYNNAWSPSASASPRVCISKDLLLAVNDHVEGYIWHDHGSNRDTISDAMYMTIHFIG